MSGWFPGAIRDPGRNAGYRVGRTKNQCAVLHFTVGRDSRALIRDKGLAAFLFPKNGRPFQFCEADSITSHACEWNDEGPGLEFERMSWGEPLTADQIKYGGEVIHWLAKTYGYPLTYHGGARLPIGSGFRGFVNHGSLVHRACDQHTDGVTAGEWNAMVAASPSPREEPRMFTIDGKTKYWFSGTKPAGQRFRKAADVEVLASVKDGVAIAHITKATYDWLNS